MGELETRTLNVEVRVEGQDKEPKLVGYAVRWDERSKPLPFIERFKKGAFANALANGGDVLALVDHDRSKVIGRRSNGTLELSEDDQGLRVVIRPNIETTYGRDVVAAVRRGDVSGMSVGFVATRDQWVPDAEAGQVREVLEAELREVSVASFPAYVGTNVQQRSEEMKDVEERKEQVATATEERGEQVTETQEQRTKPKLDVTLSTPATEQRSAFARYLRGEPYDVRALTITGAGATGGYVAPESFVAELIQALNEASVMRRLATVTGPVAAASVKFPVLTESVTANWTGEAEVIAESEPAFSQIEFTPHKLAALTLVSNELLADSAINVESLLAQLFGEEFGAKEDAAFFDGDGDGKPAGILRSKDIPTVKVNDAATIGADDILALYDALPPQYRANAVFVMHPSTMSVLRTLKDANGRYLLVDGLSQAAPTTLLGRPVHLSSHIPEIAAGKRIILFGDIRRTYRIVDRQGVNVQRSTDRYFEQDLTAFRAIKRTDGKVILPDAARFLVQTAK